MLELEPKIIGLFQGTLREEIYSDPTSSGVFSFCSSIPGVSLLPWVWGIADKRQPLPFLIFVFIVYIYFCHYILL